MEAFLELKQQYAGALTKKTGFILYSENGFTQPQIDLMEAQAVMYTDVKRLTAYLAPA